MICILKNKQTGALYLDQKSTGQLSMIENFLKGSQI